MSEATFSVTPPKEPMSAEDLTIYRNNSRRCNPCWLCGVSTTIDKYAEHVERHRRNGWKPKESKGAKRIPAQVFAEWQASDAVDATDAE